MLLRTVLTRYLAPSPRRAADGPGVIVFGKGITTSASFTNSTEKYHIAGDTSAKSTAFGAGRGVDGVAGFSSGPVGYYAQGYNGTNQNFTDKYTFADDTVATGTNQSVSNRYASGNGGPSFGIVAGSIGSGVTTKYTYSGDTVAAGTSLTGEGFLCGAAGNSSLGMWYGAYGATVGSSATRKYTFSGDTTATGTSAAAAYSSSVGTSSPSVGYFNGFNSSADLQLATARYRFSDDTVTPATALTQTAYGSGAAGNAVTGIFLQSLGTRVIKYRYRSDTILFAGYLTENRNYCGSACSVPGALQ